MRLTMRHLRESAVIAAVGLIAFAAMRVADHLIGYDSPFMPGTIFAIFIAVWIFLLRRYGPRGPVDPRRQRIWLLSGLAASGAIAAFGLIAVAWLGWVHSEPSASCLARSWTNPVSPNGDVGALCAMRNQSN